MEPAGTSSGWAWSRHDVRTVRLCAVLFGLCGGHLLVCLEAIAHRGAYPFGDFLAIWSYAKIAAAGRAADLYDFVQTHQAQLALGLPTAEVVGLRPTADMPFPYPPTFLLMIWALGWLSYPAAFALWGGATLLFYVGAVCTGTRNFWPLFVCSLVAPTTAVNLSFGQSGLLLAALLIGGLRLVDRRPVAAGVLFGLLTYKPQFGFLVPVALIAGGHWRCIAATLAMVGALAATASITFGPAIWMTWLASLPRYATWFDQHAGLQNTRASLRDNLLGLGCAPGLAGAAQVMAVILAMVLTWSSFRRGPRELAIAMLVAGTCLGAPHVLIYDLPMLAGAAMLFAQYCVRAHRAFSLREIVVLLLTLTFPASMAWGLAFPVSSAVLASFIAVLLLAGRADASTRLAASFPSPALS